MEKLTIRITQVDVHHAEQFKIINPILFMLQQATGTLWRMHDDGTACEVMARFRVTKLPVEPLSLWREYSRTGYMTPCEFELELHETQPQDSCASQTLHRVSKETR